MPEQAGSALANDQTLLAKVEELAPRVESARRRWLAAVPRPEPVIDGDRAYLRYDIGRAARFVRESGRWKVIDVE
jgi:hypothetical protein